MAVHTHARGREKCCSLPPEPHARGACPASPLSPAHSGAGLLPEPPLMHACNRWGPGLGVFPVPAAARHADSRQREPAGAGAGGRRLVWSRRAAAHSGGSPRAGAALRTPVPGLPGRHLLAPQARLRGGWGGGSQVF